MPSSRTYQFHFINIRLTIGMLITLFAGIIGILPVGIMLDRLAFGTGQSLTIAYVVVWLGVMAYFITRLIRSRNDTEAIRLTPDRLESKRFGLIPYRDIRSYEIRKGLSFINVDRPSPSLLLRMRDGRFIRFDLNVKHYDKEVAVYMAFLDDFVERMKFEQEAATAVVGGNSPQLQYEQATTDLSRAHKRRLSAQKLVIPFSLVFSILILARTCSEDVVSWFRPDPLDGLRREATTVHAARVQSLERTIADEGSVFVMGRDLDGTKPVLIPNSDRQSTTNLPLFAEAETNRAIEEFIRNKDSLGYRLHLWRDSLHVPQVRYPHVDANRPPRTLFFFVYDASASMSPYFRRGFQRQRIVAPFTLAWEIGYHHPEELAAKMERSPGYTNLVDLVFLLSRYENAQLYVATSHFHGHTHSEFEEVGDVVLSLLAEHGLDIEGFAVKEYDSGLMDI